MSSFQASACDFRHGEVLQQMVLRLLNHGLQPCWVELAICGVTTTLLRLHKDCETCGSLANTSSAAAAIVLLCNACCSNFIDDGATTNVDSPPPGPRPPTPLH